MRVGIHYCTARSPTYGGTCREERWLILPPDSRYNFTTWTNPDIVRENVRRIRSLVDWSNWFFQWGLIRRGIYVRNHHADKHRAKEGDHAPIPSFIRQSQWSMDHVLLLNDSGEEHLVFNNFVGIFRRLESLNVYVVEGRCINLTGKWKDSRERELVALCDFYEELHTPTALLRAPTSGRSH